MTISKKDIQIIIPFVLFIGVGTLGTLSKTFILRDSTMAITLKWCGIPILFFAVYYAYKATFGYPKKVAIWRNTISMATVTALCSILFFVAFEGYLILFNCNIGQQSDYSMVGTITKVESTKSKSGQISSYNISLHRKLEMDTIRIQVPTGEFIEGQLFSKKMKVGSLGFIYSDN